MKSNYYQLLGLQIKCNQEDISRAFKHQIKLIHPDKHQLQQTTHHYKQQTIQLLAAYKTLSTPQTRKQYDIQLLTSLKSQQLSTIRYFEPTNIIIKDGKWMVDCQQCMGSSQISMEEVINGVQNGQELIMSCWYCGLALSVNFQS